MSDRVWVRDDGRVFWSKPDWCEATLYVRADAVRQAMAGAPASGEPLTPREALDELTRLGQQMGDYDNDDIRTLLTSDGKGKAAKREALTRIVQPWASRCERAEAALREMASRGCRGERMMGTHCKDVCLSPAQWCEPCAAEEVLRALSGARPGETTNG